MKLYLLFALPILLAVAVIVPLTKARAHTAPSGWSYPPECCSSVDCYEVADDVVQEVPGGYYITTNKETIPYKSYKVKDSLDGKYHVCTAGGKPERQTFCIFVPPRAF